MHTPPPVLPLKQAEGLRGREVPPWGAVMRWCTYFPPYHCNFIDISWRCNFVYYEEEEETV